MNLKNITREKIENCFTKQFNNKNGNKKNRNRKNKYFFLTEGENQKNQFKNNSENKKIKLIQRLMKNPIENDPFDGFAIKGKQYNIKELIDIVSFGDNKAKFEKNKMCKKPYPLLTCLSNRNFRNNTNKFITNILIKENKIISKEFHTIINKKNINKTYQNFRLKKFPIINKKTEYIIKTNEGKKENNLNFFDHYIRNTIITKNNYMNPYKTLMIKSHMENTSQEKSSLNKNSQNLDYSNNDNKKNESNINKYIDTNESVITLKKYFKNNLIKKNKLKTVNLTYHNTVSNNINIINKRNKRLNNLSSYSKNVEYMRNFDNIIKYISKQRVNKNLAKFNNQFNSI